MLIFNSRVLNKPLKIKRAIKWRKTWKVFINLLNNISDIKATISILRKITLVAWLII
jgi:hypothetical protein